METGYFGIICVAFVSSPAWFDRTGLRWQGRTFQLLRLVTLLRAWTLATK